MTPATNASPTLLFSSKSSSQPSWKHIGTVGRSDTPKSINPPTKSGVKMSESLFDDQIFCDKIMKIKEIRFAVMHIPRNFLNFPYLSAKSPSKILKTTAAIAVIVSMTPIDSVIVSKNLPSNIKAE